MKRKDDPIKNLFLVLGILQSIISVGAIIGGIGMCIDPSGHTDGVSQELLRNSPFKDYWYPGLFLLIVHGIGNLIAALVSFFRKKNAGTTGILLGGILIAWVAIQIFWIGFSHILQPAFVVFGFAEVFIGTLIYRHYYKRR